MLVATGSVHEAIKDYKECQTVAEKTKNDACALWRAPIVDGYVQKNWGITKSLYQRED